jgi:hypothetical protein
LKLATTASDAPGFAAGSHRRARCLSIAAGRIATGEIALGCYCRSNRMPMMVINLVRLQPLVALVAGILILLVPRILNYVIAVYLILIGLVGLWPHLLR